MTNEEKAHRICETFTSIYGVDIAQEAHIYSATLEAMKWKDEQWKKRLQDAFIGGWTASLDIENVSRKRTTTISFVKEDFNV